jgi:glycosyltransferase involved in cell wall biosynthesis
MRILVNLHPFPNRGGGERYMLEVATTLSERHQVDLLTVGTIDTAAAARFHGLPVDRLGVVSFRRHPSFVVRLIDRIVWRWPEGNVYKKLFTATFGGELTRGYDLFINGESGHFVTNEARKGMFIVFFPWEKLPQPERLSVYRRIYRSGYDYWVRRDDHHHWETYDVICPICEYSRQYTERWIERSCRVLYPPIDERFVPREKKKRILMLGRFMTGDPKGQFFGVQQFRQITAQLPEWQMVCAGSLWPDEPSRGFFEELQRATDGLSVTLLPNVPFDELVRLVGESSVFWHTMGYGKDIETHPILAEHFGMPTVECMRAGCVPIGFRGGGQIEIISEGENGFLWSTPEELRDKTLQLAAEPSRMEIMAASAIGRAESFSREHFRKTLNDIVNGLFATAEPIRSLG